MTATEVYGIAIGDKFADDDGEVFEVIRFITPPNPSADWKAVVQSDQIEEESQMPVKELMHMQEVLT